MSGTGDAALVRRARAGDRAALARLVSQHRPLVLSLCRRMVGATPLAEDAAQEAVLQALLHLDRLRRPERFGPWLAGIGLNLCRLWLRERSRGPESWEALVGGGRPWAEPVDAGPDPAELAATAELSARVRAAVMALPRGQRAAVLLHYLAGLTQAEAAATLGVAPGAVKARLHKARRALGDQLRTLWTEETMTTRTDAGPIEVRVHDVRRVERSDAAPRYVVILEELGGEERFLPIWMGQIEAEALVEHLEGIETPRPQTHDFTAGVLRTVQARVQEVLIDRLVDDVYYASVVLAGPGGTGAADARPSDALNLALRAGAPLRVQPDVLAAAGLSRDQAKASEPAGEVQGRPEIAAAIRGRLAQHAAQMQQERAARRQGGI
ncbi:MAG TPA: bifunctional nuclease domain-containing protein [Chloroflexota bacterium]